MGTLGSFEAMTKWLRASANPSQHDDLQEFNDEQLLMRRLLGEPASRILRLDTSDNSVLSVVERIAGELEKTGSHYM